jgi:hypothetical protein
LATSLSRPSKHSTLQVQPNVSISTSCRQYITTTAVYCSHVHDAYLPDLTSRCMLFGPSEWMYSRPLAVSVSSASRSAHGNSTSLRTKFRKLPLVASSSTRKGALSRAGPKRPAP